MTTNYNNKIVIYTFLSCYFKGESSVNKYKYMKSKINKYLLKLISCAQLF